MSATDQEIKQEYRRNHAARKMAQRLGWLSIGLGVAELLMPGPLARTLGIPGGKTLLRFCGVREIASGVGLLVTKHPKPWMLGRVGGDVMDMAVLGGAVLAGDKPVHALLAAGTVAGVTSLDLACARGLATEDHLVTVYDYSDRSGFPESPDKMRGRASKQSDINTAPQVTGMAAADRETQTRH
ncbi:MAG TPA: transcriptional regulator [Pseudomonas xinjiangensis]|uniref:Transcriptional regulator n=2 Tax=root TaxID=1 RepID=A0A7V1FRB4_9GAMM|nr:transcriptional regulator [Halopseudomonas xinjiangensis]HEC47967.1 transcriptional regulator [Halopseudomonas xinjiangensis]